MASPRKQNEPDPSIDRRKRQWLPNTEKEASVIRRFLGLCQEKLPSAVIVETPQSVLQQTVDKILADEVSFEQLQELDMDEFYDYLIGQRRLFDDLQSGD